MSTNDHDNRTVPQSFETLLGDPTLSPVPEFAIQANLARLIARVPNFEPPSIQEGEVCPLPPTCTLEEINEYRSAASFLRSLAEEVRAWRQKLPEDYRPVVIALIYGGMRINVRSLAQVSFDGIRIEGTIDGSPCSLFTHQSTVQMLCFAEKIDNEDQDPPKRPIGFIWPESSLEV